MNTFGAYRTLSLEAVLHCTHARGQRATRKLTARLGPGFGLDHPGFEVEKITFGRILQCWIVYNDSSIIDVNNCMIFCLTF